MTAIRNLSAQIVAAGTALALSLVMIGTTVSTPAQTGAAAPAAQEIMA